MVAGLHRRGLVEISPELARGERELAIFPQVFEESALSGLSTVVWRGADRGSGGACPDPAR
ncbi:MAG TPA: hypothetical protein VME46_23735, partial [Acidimicrobiales bacterium]|nr:hypothetical protein [Acidimicrobiales bacterium]